MDVDQPQQQRPNSASRPAAVEDDDPVVTDSSGPRVQKLPSGAVGKLRIHKSGKATLDWGGTKLSVGMGGEVGFLQDIVVLGLPDKKVGAEGAEGAAEKEDAGPGWAMGMGQVKGKFVVTPDWSDVLG